MQFLLTEPCTLVILKSYVCQCQSKILYKRLLSWKPLSLLAIDLRIIYIYIVNVIVDAVDLICYMLTELEPALLKWYVQPCIGEG